MSSFRVGDVLELVRRPVKVDPTGEYREVGIRSFGRGIFHKDPVSGLEIQGKRVFYIRPGDLVFSNVFAWEGAVALASEKEDGRVGSHRFMTYRVDESIADPSYLKYFFHSKEGLGLVRRASPGSAGRNRTLGIKNFAAQELEMPRIDEQRRIAAKLDRASKRVNYIREILKERSKLRQAYFDALIDDVLGMKQENTRKRVRLGDVAAVNPRPVRLSAEEDVAFVPMAKVDERSGAVVGAEYRTSGEAGKGYKQFFSGDVIFARITPCMQNGKVAIFRDPSVSVALGSTEFHVVRPEGVSAEWMHAICRSRTFREEAAKNMSGTAGQQRVPAQFIQDAQIPVPRDEKEELETLREVYSINCKRLRVESLHREQEEHLKALRSSLLNSAFSGKL